RSICLAFPQATERPSHGAPTFFVRDRVAFLTLWEHGHHDHVFPHFWCAAPPGAQEALVASEPGLFFRPPYVGQRGWLGVRLDATVDWVEIAELCRDAYRTVAPRRLIDRLDAEDAG
ncbi:MAG TPA: MmcQ/YjbR family DNA-binding protein, partial [Catenuloplanes sp.]